MKQINNIGQLLNHLKVLVYLLSLYFLGQSLDHPKMLVSILQSLNYLRAVVKLHSKFMQILIKEEV